MDYCTEHPEELTKVAAVQKKVGFLQRHDKHLLQMVLHGAVRTCDNGGSSTTWAWPNDGHCMTAIWLGSSGLVQSRVSDTRQQLKLWSMICGIELYRPQQAWLILDRHCSSSSNLHDVCYRSTRSRTSWWTTLRRFLNAARKLSFWWIRQTICASKYAPTLSPFCCTHHSSE